MGEGAHEEGYRRGSRRKGRLHCAIELPTCGRSNVHGLWRRQPGHFPANHYIYRTPHTEKMHVVERWRMVDGGDGMEVVFTVEDPDAFYQTWTGMRHYRRVQYQDIPEVVCAENNYQSMFGYPVP